MVTTRRNSDDDVPNFEAMINCPIRFDDRIRPVNLLPIHMLDFDVILGMD
ncbi:hypothetical protein Tco_0549917, partial [Tanacetum coccineum]